MSRAELDQLHDFPYRRLAALFGDDQPGKSPLLTHIGEPQGNPPALLEEAVAKNSHLWSKYPPINGTPDYRKTVADWATKRFGLDDGYIDPDNMILPACGTREALFLAALMAAARKRAMLKEGTRPVICLPNPLYHVYFGGALMAQADIVAVDATAENNFVPDYESLSPEILDRTALVFLCSPGNPTGTVASLARLKTMIEAARRHDFILAVDECYSEIWFDSPPPGGLEACAALGGGLDNVMVFNSLSKRSSAPGLRNGVIIGPPDLMADFQMLRGYGGAQVPGPLLAAATALWADNGHADENRRLYNRLVDIATEELGNLPGFSRPEAAFFLWYDVAKCGMTGEQAAKRLWAEQGVKVMPGRYMSRADETGKTPGDDFIRIALVHDEETTRDLCDRIRQVVAG